MESGRILFKRREAPTATKQYGMNGICKINPQNYIFVNPLPDKPPFFKCKTETPPVGT